MNIAIVGATGNVGRKILEVLEKKELSIDNLYLIASSRSAGSKINFLGNEHEVLNLETFDFSKAKITFFAAGGKISEKFAEKAAKHSLVIDNSFLIIAISLLAFLFFNWDPAKIFMGDTGSLSLGGSLGAVGIITKHEIVLAITGGLFVLEAFSVMVQVISFKLTGKRIFRMAPIHHHFEKKGWPESTVVIRFWIISIILAMIGLATLKLR